MDLTTEAANIGAFLSVPASLLRRNPASTMLEEIPCGAAALADAATDLRGLSGNSGSTAWTDVKTLPSRGVDRGSPLCAEWLIRYDRYTKGGLAEVLALQHGSGERGKWRPVAKGGVGV